MKFLIADDDRIFVELVTARLRAKGHKVLAAQDAMQAFMFAMREAPDLIVLDLKMPGGTGFDTLKKLRSSAKTAPIPVIVVSGVDDAKIPDQARALGAAEFVPKPLKFDELAQALGRVLGTTF